MEIDHLEVDVEEDCLKILALHQPVAVDLRFIVAVLKINNDLERIGDLAVNIAERSLTMAGMPAAGVPFDFSEMARRAQAMLRKSLDALVDLDENLAREVLPEDDAVDAMQREVFELVSRPPSDRQDIAYTLHQLLIARHLERIADHATNIANDVIYMVRGEIMRHKHEFPPPPQP